MEYKWDPNTKTPACILVSSKIDGEQINRNEKPLYCGLFCPAIVGAKSPAKLARRLLGQDVF